MIVSVEETDFFFIRIQLSLGFQNESYLATNSSHWSRVRGSLKVKHCRSFRTKESIQRIDIDSIFRFNINTKSTASFLQWNFKGGSQWIIVMCVCKEKTMMRTFEKWYSFGNDISMDKFPSSDEMASMVIGTVSAVGRLLRRLKDFDFGLGGWTPLSSKVQSWNSLAFKSRYRIRLLFVSAMNSLPVKRINNNSKTELISNLFHFLANNWIKESNKHP